MISQVLPSAAPEPFSSEKGSFVLQYHYIYNIIVMIYHSISLLSTLMANIQVRISDEDKKAAEAVLDELGIDMTTAVRVYLKKIVLTGEIPFAISSRRVTANGFTSEFEEEIAQASREVAQGKHVSKAYSSVDDMIGDLQCTDED